MILVDANIIIAHLQMRDPIFVELFSEERILVHPFTIGEIAMGRIAERDVTLAELQRLRSAPTAWHGEVLRMVEREQLFAKGIGFIDAHLLAATRLVPEGNLWTRDKRLLREAARLGIAFQEAMH